MPPPPLVPPLPLLIGYLMQLIHAPNGNNESFYGFAMEARNCSFWARTLSACQMKHESKLRIFLFRIWKFKHCYWSILRNVRYFAPATIAPMIYALTLNVTPNLTLTLIILLNRTLLRTKNPIITLTLTLCRRRYHYRSNCRRNKCLITLIRRVDFCRGFQVMMLIYITNVIVLTLLHHADD